MRHTLSYRAALAVGAGLITVGFPATRLLGYATSGQGWATNQVVYYVNPQSVWVSPSLAASALQSAADAWTQQTSANVQLVYGGPTSGSTMQMNGRNEVFFRNDTSGALAETYRWRDGSGNLVDADIVFHENYPYYAFSGCVDSGVYVEDVAIHEFGHALGLGHSATVGATMYPSLPAWCDTSQESLDPDDIAGIEALYPSAQVPATPTQVTAVQNASSPSTSLSLSWRDNATTETSYQIDRSADGTSFVAISSVGANVQSFTDSGLSAGMAYYYRVRAVNASGSSAFSNIASAQTASSSLAPSAPVISISTPYTNSSYPSASSISFSGNASDTTDGNISATLVWTSSLQGQIGTGASFSKALSAGTHTITAQATDASGLTGSAQVTVAVTVDSSQSSGPSLSARGYKVKGAQRVDLTWSGFAGGSVDVYRNGSNLITTPNDGAQTDQINQRGTFVYQVCVVSLCSPSVTVKF